VVPLTAKQKAPEIRQNALEPPTYDLDIAPNAQGKITAMSLEDGKIKIKVKAGSTGR
jgi:hypothetical protein